ncbi:MAG: NADPH-dependent 7-cyano-7-deazaguanine reductase QueF [Alteromonadaceae bacterium]|nr:MAG: NADPH-dependent 7-cyano-7-deazaguanine reductase QueF [Alteromonadaceae bacterium]
MNEKVALGKSALYRDSYAPELLEPIGRDLSRSNLFQAALPFTGVDIWTAYELSWLTPRGKPQVAIAEFEFPFDSKSIVESKSFKYYLNSLNQTVYSSWLDVRSLLIRDLSRACGGEVNVRLCGLDDALPLDRLSGNCVDGLDVEIDGYMPSASLLALEGEQSVSDVQMYSHLLKSNCPVTGQPDWASVWVEYSGKKICPSSFLRYVISYRQHQDFHENCVEKFFKDITDTCQPEALSVYARYTRRGGLDINPFRTNCGRAVPARRLSRQ